MSEILTNSFDELGLNNEAYGFQDPDVSVFKTKEGLDEDVVRQISAMKGEPEWMLDYIKPDAVHVMMDGHIVRSGDDSLALELEAKGYEWLRSE